MANFFLMRLPRRSSSTVRNPSGGAGWAAIPVTLSGILLHRAQHVLSVLLGLVFVKERDDLALRVIAQLLGDRYEPYAVFGDLAQIEFEAKGITEEAGKAKHNYGVKGVLAITGTLDHALELGALVVGR
jgi:hypothetical protein